MVVKVVTDSLSDITADLAQKNDITVVPLTVSFGRESFLDRITMTTDEFYHRLSYDSTWPTTTQPPPGIFAEVYSRLGKETNEILVVTVSSKLSGTYDSALNARDLVSNNKNLRIAVIDSTTVVMGLGLIVLTVAREAKAGADLDTLAARVKTLMPKSHAIMYFDTLKYLVKGGRIGKARGLVGSLLSVKPILTMKDGEVYPITRVRSRAAGMDHLYRFVAESRGRIAELAVEHATTPSEADEFAKRLNPIFPTERIFRSTVSPVIGTYAGPNVISVSILETDGK